MGQNRTLYDILKECCEHVYFQPPETVKLDYPCIIYELSVLESGHANNYPYLRNKRYTMTAITRDPLDELPHTLADLQYCRHDRSFTVDNLYHHVFTIYYSEEPMTKPKEV